MFGRVNSLHRLLRSLSLVWPPAWTFLGLFGFLAILESLSLWIAWFEGDWGRTEELHKVRDAFLVGCAAAYGCYRVWQSHPLFHKDYREFLARTPWDRTRPLPLAPLHIAPQDLLLLGLFLAPMLFRPQLSPALVPLAFLFALMAAWGLALVLTGESALAWLTALGLGLSLRLSWWNPWAALLAVAVTYPIAWHGIWRSLAAFPWTEALNPQGQSLYRRFLELRPTADTSRHAAVSSIGEVIVPLWPWSVLALDRPERLVVPINAWAWSFQAGWIAYALLSGLPEPATPRQLAESRSMVIFTMTVAAAIGALVRLIVYTSSHRSPLSLWARIRIGPLILPAYDVVAITPLLTFIAGTAVSPVVIALGWPLEMAVGLAVALILGLAFTGPPRLRHWQLTAPARLTPPAQAKRLAESI